MRNNVGKYTEIIYKQFTINNDFIPQLNTHCLQNINSIETKGTKKQKWETCRIRFDCIYIALIYM